MGLTGHKGNAIITWS